MRRFGAVALFGLFACNGDFVFVELPAPPGAETVWFGVRRGGEQIDEVYELRSAPAFEGQLEANDRLSLSYFAESLAQLQLTEGRIDLADDSSCFHRAPPPPTVSYQWLDGELVVLDSDPLEARAYRYELPCPCHTFEITLRPLPALGSIRSIVDLGQRRALVVVSVPTGGSSLLVYDDTTGTLTETATLTPAVTAACSSGASPAFLARLGGGFGTFEPSAGLRALPKLPTSDFVDQLECSPSGSAMEVFALDQAGRAHRYAQGQWTTPHDRESVGNSIGNNQSAMSWIAPERVVFVANDGDEIVYLDHGRATTVPWGTGETIAPTRGGVEQLLFTGQLGLIMLTRAQNLLRDENVVGDWQEFALPPNGAEQAAAFADLVEIEGGLLLPSTQSAMWEYNQTLSDYCERVSISGKLELKVITRLADDLLLSGGDSDSVTEANQLVVLRGR